MLHPLALLHYHHGLGCWDPVLPQIFMYLHVMKMLHVSEKSFSVALNEIEISSRYCLTEMFPLPLKFIK